jgi:hypothetical protein
MKTLLLASLIAASAASAAPAPTVVFALDHEFRSGSPTEHLEVRSNGAWSFTKGKVTHSGRLSKSQLRKVRALVNDSWTTRPSPLMCAVVADEFTDYFVAGKLVWTREVCTGDFLVDAQTKKDLDSVLAMLRSVTHENF